jgi:hypothetical protein
MIAKARQAVVDPTVEVTLGADKGYDAAEFIKELQRLKVTPHVAQNKSGRSSAVPDEIAQSEGSRCRNARGSSSNRALDGPNLSVRSGRSWCAASRRSGNNSC